MSPVPRMLVPLMARMWRKMPPMGLMTVWISPCRLSTRMPVLSSPLRTTTTLGRRTASPSMPKVWRRHT